MSNFFFITFFWLFQSMSWSLYGDGNTFVTFYALLIAVYYVNSFVSRLTHSNVVNEYYKIIPPQLLNDKNKEKKNRKKLQYVMCLIFFI